MPFCWGGGGDSNVALLATTLTHLNVYPSSVLLRASWLFQTVATLLYISLSNPHLLKGTVTRDFLVSVFRQTVPLGPTGHQE